MHARIVTIADIILPDVIMPFEFTILIIELSCRFQHKVNAMERMQMLKAAITSLIRLCNSFLSKLIYLCPLS